MTATAAAFDTPTVDPRSLVVREAAYELVDQLVHHAEGEGPRGRWRDAPIDLLDAARAVLAAEIQPALAAAWTAAGAGPSADSRAPSTPAEDWLGRARRGLWRLGSEAESHWLPRWRPPAAGASPRLLFLDYFAPNVEVLLPVWRHFDALGPGRRLYVAGRRSVAAALRRRGVHALDGARLPPALSVADPDPGAWRSFVVSFVREVWPEGWPPCDEGLLQSLVGLSPIVAEARRWALRLAGVFERFRPTAVLVSTGTSVDARVAELLAHRFGAIALHLQHGAYDGDAMSRHFAADAICFWGPFHRDLVARHPVLGRMLATGSPKHDALLAALKSIAQQDRPTIVYYSPRPGGRCLSRAGYREHFAAVVAAAERRPGWDFVVKLHPGDSGEVLRRTPTGAPTNLRITRADDPYRLLREASVALVFSSTVAYEAILFDRRVVMLNLTDLPDWLAFPRPDMARRVTAAGDLAAVLDEEVSARRLGPPGRELLWIADGRAVERVAALARTGLGDQIR